MMTFFAMALTIMSPLLTNISKTFRLSLAQTGTIFTANFLGFTLFVVIGGILSDRFGKKLVLTVSLLGYTLALLLFPLASNFSLAFITIVLIGGFGGTIEGTISALITDINTEQPSFYLNLAQVFFGIGAIVGPISAGILVSSGFSWQICYYFLAGVFLLITIGFCSAKLPPLPKSDKLTWQGFTQLVNDPKFLLICLCMVLYTGSEIGGWGWMSTFLKQNLKFTATKSSIAVAVFWSAMSVGRLICGRLSLRYPDRNIIIGLAIISTIVTILSGLLVNQIAVLLAIAMMGFGYSSLWPLIASYGAGIHPENSGTVYALLIGCGSIGGAIIPLLMGILAQNINIRAAMISPAFLFFIIILIFSHFKRVRGK
jgi:fucose permease